MSLFINPVTISLVAVVIVLIVKALFTRSKEQRILKELGYLGPKPSLLFGNFLGLRPKATEEGRPYRLDILQKWYKQYGKIFGFYIGSAPIIMVADLDLVREIFVKESDNFTNRPSAREEVKDLVSQVDQRWKDLRRILTPTFSAQKLKSMTGTMESCVTTLLEVIEEERVKGEELEIYKFLQNLTMDVIFKCALAQDSECQRHDSASVNAVKNLFLLKINTVISMIFVFPSLRSIIGKVLGFQGSRNTILESLVENLKAVIADRRTGKAGTFKDVLALLLEAAEGKHEAELKLNKKTENPRQLQLSDSEGSSEDGVKEKRKEKVLLTDQEIIDNAVVFLLAGYETTSNALGYTMYSLAINPHVQEKAQAEIERVLKGKTSISYDDVNEMQYIEQVLSESMRMYPPVVAFVSRTCKETVTIRGWTFPKGCVVEAPVYLIHYDHDYYPDPHKFDPERFSPDRKGERHPLAYLPFGVGPRKCIGERFALLEAKLCLAKILQKYTVKPSKRTQIPLQTIVRTLLMNPRDGVWIHLEPR